MEMVSTDIRSLAGQYVICKRVKKVPYYYRGDHYKQTSMRARDAHKFNNKEEAQKKCLEINSKRMGKGYRFRVEEAEKHFVSSFSLQLNYWSNTPTINILHEYRSIQNVTQNRQAIVQDLNSTKENLLKSIETRIQACKNEMEHDLKEFEERKRRLEEKEKHFKELMNFTNNTDFNAKYVEPNLTKTDKNINILFGKKTNVNP